MPQIAEVGQNSIAERQQLAETIKRAIETFNACGLKSTATAARLDQSRSLTSFPVACPIEPFGAQLAIQAGNRPATVVAVDGSQVMPSHHEIYSCFLINIGTTVISYGSQHPPSLESQPTLFHRQADLYPKVDGQRIHVDELYVSLERHILELETAAAQALLALKRDLPCLVLLDGSLIPWSLEKMPESYCQAFLNRATAALEALRQADIPLLGYISHSRSADLINCLRVCICPYKISNCKQFCHTLSEDEYPCAQVWPLADRLLLEGILPYRSRTASLLADTNSVRWLPAPQQTCFIYLNVGSEIARLEFPHWLADNPDLLDWACQRVLEQVEKGFGYPVCLTESHLQAVVKAADRNRFFNLLDEHLNEAVCGKFHISPKESSKRRSFI